MSTAVARWMAPRLLRLSGPTPLAQGDHVGVDGPLGDPREGDLNSVVPHGCRGSRREPTQCPAHLDAGQGGGDEVIGGCELLQR